MKTPESYLLSKRITPMTKHHDYGYLYRSMVEIIEQVQKEAWNEAIESAAQNAKVKPFSGGGTLFYNPDNLDKDSILNLKW